jgi:hypothetical protein
MEGLTQATEKRKHPRTLISLPLHFQLNEEEGSYPGSTIDASEAGILIQSLKEMDVGIRIDIEVLFPEKLNLANFKAEAEIIWKDNCYWEDWEGYQYGLKFVTISKEDYSKLKRALNNPSWLKEVDLVERGNHRSTLIVKTE